MKFNRKLLSAVMLVVMLVTTLMPAASAVELKATYEKPTYYSVATAAYSRMLVFQNGVVPAANAAGKFGLIDAAGTAKVPFQYDSLATAAGGLFIAGKADSYGLIDSTGKVVLPITANQIQVRNQIIAVTTASYTTTYYTAAMKASTEDAFYADGNSDASNPSFGSDEVPGYNWVSAVGGDYYVGASDAGSALLDSDKKVVVAAGKYSDFRYVSAEGQSAMFVVIGSNDQSGVIDATGKIIVPLADYDYVGEFNAKGQLAVATYDTADNVKTNIKSTLFDTKGTVVKTWADREVNTASYYRDLVFSLDGKHYGTMDANDKTIIPNNFISLDPEAGTTKMIVAVDNPNPDSWSGLMGIYSVDGKELITPKYEELKLLGSDRYRLYDGAKYGVMSADTGKTIIPFNYTSMQVFTRDFIYLFDGTTYSVVTADNKVVVPASTSGIAVFNDYEPISRELDNYNANRMQDNYDSTILPFVSKTAGGYTTTYANYITGEVLGTLPYMASNITSDGRFVYRGDNGLFGFGTLTSAGFQNPAAPASGAGAATGGNVAYATTGYKIQVDGKLVNFDLYALKDANGNDTNYIKLRDVAQQLSGTKAQFSVGWDGAINLTRGAAYVPNGSEMSTPFSGNQTYQTSTSPVMVDGEKSDLSAILLTDTAGNGFTYFKLRDLGKALGFDVTFENGVIVIDSTQAYSGT